MPHSPSSPTLRPPRAMGDAMAMYELAAATQVLDVNSPYAYLLWCRDFAATSVAAIEPESGHLVGFVTGYRRPSAQSTLMIWQVAVDASQRGRGLASSMLDELTRRTSLDASVSAMETTITDDNAASKRLFTGFAERHGATVTTESLFTEQHFASPTATAHATHEAEILYKIGPLNP